MLLDDDQMTEQDRRSWVILNLIQSLLGYFQPLKWLKSSAEAELQDFSAVWKSCSVSHVVMFPRQQQRTTCRASGCI